MEIIVVPNYAQLMAIEHEFLLELILQYEIYILNETLIITKMENLHKA